jgi:hypothetical protein
MAKKLIYLLLICLYFNAKSGLIHAQVTEDIEAYIYDKFIEDSSVDLAEWTNQLQDRTLQKLDLNKLDEIELIELGLLNDNQVRNILAYREALGPFLDVHELQAVSGINQADAKMLSLFVSVPLKTPDIQNYRKRILTGANRVLFRWSRTMEKQQGYKTIDSLGQAYRGDPNAFLIKWQYNAAKLINSGIIIEKDAGEKYFDSSHRGFDHIGFYLSLKPENSALTKIILGDYKVNMGQGLLCHASFLGSKSALVMNIVRSGTSFRKHSASTEYGYKRGIATEWRIKRFRFSFFISANKVDTKLSQDTLVDGERSMTGIILTGYHRTSDENQMRSNQLQTSVGSILGYHSRLFKIGLNFKFDRFEKAFGPTSKLYQLYRPPSNAFMNVSIDHNLRLFNINFSGEIARSMNGGGVAMVQSAQVILSKKIDFGFLYRNYSSAYFSLEGSAFGSATQTGNEKGLYLALIIEPASEWRLSAFLDCWKFPWLKYNIDAPTLGYEYFIKLDYIKKRRLKAYLLFKTTMKQKNLTVGTFGVKPIINDMSNSIRSHLNLNLTRAIEIRTRIEMKYSESIWQSAFLIYQEVIYSPLDKAFSFSVRYALYNTPDHIVGFYTFERDVVHSYNSVSYSRSGVRVYFNLRYKLLKAITFELKLAHSFYPFEKTFSSSHELISHNHRSNIKFQIRYKF